MITDDIRQSTILLTSLEKRRLRGDLIEVFKLVTGKEHIDMIDYSNLLQLDDTRYDTRGHRYKLKKRRSRLDIRKYFFSNRIVSIWNSLPSHVVEADSVLTFKKRLDDCIDGALKALLLSPTSTSTSTSNECIGRPISPRVCCEFTEFCSIQCKFHYTFLERVVSPLWYRHRLNDRRTVLYTTRKLSYRKDVRAMRHIIARTISPTLRSS